MKKKKITQTEGFISLLSSLFAILGGLIGGLIILLLSNPSQAFNGLGSILVGSFATGTSGIETMIYMSIPIIMTGLSVGFAFKTGLFNIGAPGQFTVGACAAILVGIRWTFLPSSIHWIVAILVAMVAGMVWGAIVGILKSYLNVNEVISSIMLNYIGLYLVNMIIGGSDDTYDLLRNQSLPVAKSANLPKGFLASINPDTKLTVGIFVVIAIVIVLHIVINKTTFGYELTACGMNKEATKYAGINSKRNIVYAMLIAGGLAGIGGALCYLSGIGKYWQLVDVVAAEGFAGIAVSLLGANSPIGIFFAGLFIQHMTLGGLQMQLFGFTPQVIDIIIAVIIYCAALSLLFKSIITKIFSNKRGEDKK